jgi:dimethylamine/trimethylamine dehydrogenase
MSNEQPQVHRALESAGIALHTLSRVSSFGDGSVTLANQFTNSETVFPCDSLVIVGTRFANDALYAELMALEAEFAHAAIRSVSRVGDALAPGAIVHATYSGHRYAEEFDADSRAIPYRRDAPLPRHA